MMQPPPNVNQLPTPRATLKVANIPSFVTGEDFSRLMLQLEGCVDARLMGRQPGGDQVGYGEFSDKLNASKARNLYHGWTGWGGRGLSIELTDFSMSQMNQQQQAPGQKRLREEEDLLQPGNNYKQPRPDMAAMGMPGAIGGGMGTNQRGMPQQAPQAAPAQQDTGAVSGLLQNLTNMTSLLQQQGIAQQLLAAAAQQSAGGGGGGMLAGNMGTGGQAGGGSGGVYEPYNPAAPMAPSNPMPQQPQQQQMGGMMGGGGGGMMPQQQQLPPQQQQQMGGMMGGGTGGMMPQQQQQQPPMQYQEQPQMGGNYMGQPNMQQPQQQPTMQAPMQQQPQQQPYGMAPQPQSQMMQPGMGQVGGGMMQPQQPQMMQQQPSQQGPPMMQQAPPQQQPGMPPGMGPGPGGRRGDIVAPTAMRQYPPDACNTLYIEGLPADITRRELSHIFRPHEGFRSLRLVIKDSKKHPGEKMVMVFAEYSNTYFATEAMDKLQGYPFDLDDPETVNFFIKYARPMAGGRPMGGPPMMGGGRGRGGPPPVMGGGRGGGPGPGPDMHGPGRGGGMDGRGGRGMGGRGAGRFGPGPGYPPRESPRGRDY